MMVSGNGIWKAGWHRAGAFVLVVIAASAGCSTVKEETAPVAAASLARATRVPRIVLAPLAPIDRCLDVCRVVSHFWTQEKCFPIADTAAAGYCLGTLPAIGTESGTSSVRASVRYLSGRTRFTQHWFGRVSTSSPLELQLGTIREDPASVVLKDGFESGDLSAWSFSAPR